MNRLVDKLRDARSRRVVFLSHCLLNENTRYPGGACRPGGVSEVVQRCLREDLGIVQMPCPEQRAWGGVLKTRFVPVFGFRERHPLLYRLRRPALWFFLLYTRLVYRLLARQVASEIQDYVDSGFDVTGIVGVDGSPTCGVHTTLSVHQAVDGLACLRATELSREEVNRCVRASATEGSSLFTSALRCELQRRGISAQFSAHDLIAELEAGQ